MKKEEWRFVVGYEGLYMVSNFGRVKSLNYGRTGKEKIMKPDKTNSGYIMIDLHKDGKHKRHYIHRLVWEAFNGPIPKGMQINHLNERKDQNNLENLSLVSAKTNCNWGTRNRRITKKESKMVEQYTLDGTHICTWFSVSGIEKELGYSKGNVSSCCNGKLKAAYGYIWKYR